MASASIDGRDLIAADRRLRLRAKLENSEAERRLIVRREADRAESDRLAVGNWLARFDRARLGIR